MTEATKHKAETVMSELEIDIAYFDKMSFTQLSEKFKRDLNIIKSLVQEG